MNQTTTQAMTARQAEAIASIALMAAFADRRKDEAEQAKLKEVFGTFGTAGTASVYQRVILGNVVLADEVAALGTPELRTLAYEMAVGVCDADGVTNDEERAFLGRLAAALGVEGPRARQVVEEAEALVALPAVFAGPGVAAGGSSTAPATAAAPSPVEAELDRTILQSAILAGALELLPQNLATLAIVPLQMKLVYDVGARYGYKLDAGHAKEFVATVGVGMTSQVLEGYARKFLGGFVKKMAGKGAAGLAGAATGAAMSFASTWALGQVAKSYYGGGRNLDMADLQRRFQEQVGQGQALFDRYRGEVETRARNVNTADLKGFLRF